MFSTQMHQLANSRSRWLWALLATIALVVSGILTPVDAQAVTAAAKPLALAKAVTISIAEGKITVVWNKAAASNTTTPPPLEVCRKGEASRQFHLLRVSA